MNFRDFEKEWNNNSDYVVAHTSGSTGIPKEIRLLKSDMIASAKMTNERFGIDSQSVLGLPLSMDYIAGKMMAVRAFVAGCELIEITPSNYFELPCRVDLLSIVPTQVDCVLTHAKDSTTDSNWHEMIGNILIGGAELSFDRHKAVYSAGYRAYSTYGMTETCSHVALMKIDGNDNPFIAMPGITFETDHRGCLVINAPMFSQSVVITNDIVEIHDSKSFRWLGRFDNVINSGGIKISPESLEKEISKYIDNEFYIVGMPDQKWGQAVCMVAQGSKEEESRIMSLLRERLNHRLVPKKIVMTERIPRTSNGKIRRILI